MIQLVRRGRVGADKTIGQPNCAKFYRNEFEWFAFAENRDLGRAAADVDVQTRESLLGATLRSCEPDQSCFFDARQNFNAQTGFVFHSANELFGIVCFTHRSRRDRGDPLRAVSFSNGTKTLETIYSAASRGLADVTIDERLLAQPDDFAFTREHSK